jgi:hypothetical protein
MKGEAQPGSQVGDLASRPGANGDGKGVHGKSDGNKQRRHKIHAISF